MILFAFLVSLLSAVCDKDKSDKRNNGYDAFCVPGVEKSGFLGKGSVVRMFCKIHNSSVEMKGILLEKIDNCVMIEMKAGSLLLVEGSVFVRKNEWNGHFVRNGGTCWLINTTLGVGNGEECGMMGSVVKMDRGGLPMLFVRNSEFEDVVLCGSGGSILREGAGGFEEIKNCRFANITMKIIETEEIQTGKEWMMKRSKMEDCLVERSMNVLEGGIASGTEGSGSFNCNNCTFVQNERVNRKVRNTERNTTTETIEFTNAEWNECSAPCGGALYVHDNSNATLTVENSSFVKCNATSTRGGGIYALKIAECTVKHSTFVECYCVSSNDYGGAGAEIEGMAIQVFIENCLFKDGWSRNDGGGLDILSSKANKTKDCVLDCLFVNCCGRNATSSSGGGFDNWITVDKIVLRNCLFQGCHSDWKGGAISFLTNGYNGNLLWFCFFHNNTATFGNDIHVDDNYTDSQIVFCFSTRSEGVRYNAKGIDKSEWLPNEGGRSRFVGSKESQENAKDTFSCGLNESCACLTISHCLSQMIVGFVEEIKVLSGKVVEGKGVDIGEKTISVNGASSLGSTIETKFEANSLSLFCVGTGKLVVSDLSVIHNSSFENNRQCRLFEVEGSGLMDVKRMDISMDAAHSEEKSIQRSLVKVEGGELKMKDVRWGRTFSTTSLISVPQESSATLTLGNCTFSNIVRTTTGSSLMSVGEVSHSITLEECTIDGCGSEDSEFGGGMMVAVGSGGSLNVKGGIAKNCYASTTQGRGGGIGLKVRETNANFHISSAFEGNRAKWGNDIFIDSPNLESAARSGKITSLTASNPLLDEIRGFDKGDDSTPIPLGAYLIPLPDEIYVSSVDAFNHSLCGFAEFPCLTLRHCLTRQEEEKKIVVDGMIEVKNELTFGSFKHTIRGKDENSGWKVIDDSDGSGESMITVSANANISSLTFSVPSALQNHEVFFFSSSQFFSLEDCSLSLQNSQSALSFVFLSVSAGEVSVSSFSTLSLSIGNHPLISLAGRSVAGTFTSMSVEDINSDAQSVLFGVADGASITIEDSTLSVKASLQADLPSGSIRVISASSAKSVKLLNNTMSGFKGDGGDGGAVECTLGRDCSLEIVGGTMCGCESNGGNGGGLWVEIGEGSSFTVGNITDSSLLRTKTSNDESNLLQLESCKATQTADGEEGKEIFINAHDLSSVINRESISFGVELNDFTKLNGFERSTLNETFAIPLVVYLWNNFSAPAFVGGSLGHDFSMCGYESSPCSTILKAVSLHFEGKNKDVSICEPFSFDEELDLTSNEWSIASKENEMKCEVSDQKEGAQNGLVESSVSVFVTGIIFSLKKSLTDHESVFECHSEKLTLTKCGMEGGDEAISTVFVKAAGGVVEINEFATKNMKIGDSSVFVVEGNAESVPSMNMTKSNFAEITFGDGSVVECHNGNIDEMSGCTFSSITRSKESGGCISVVNNENDDDGREHKVEIDDCTFEGCAVAGDKGNEIGGGAFFYEASANTNLLISGCEFYCCTAPHEEEGVGYGGGIMLKMQKQEEEEGKAGFVISSPVFSTDKPNNAKFGKDLFISSPLLIKSIKNETLPFVKDRLELLTEDSMRGYDGGNRECAIPLIYFWKEIGSSVFITEEGKNVAVVFVFRSEFIFVSSVVGNSSDSKQCGEMKSTCSSLDVGVSHIIPSDYSQLLIWNETTLTGSCSAQRVTIKSMEASRNAEIKVSEISLADEGVVRTSESVRLEKVSFVFGGMQNVVCSCLIHQLNGSLILESVSFHSESRTTANPQLLFDASLIVVEDGVFEADACSVNSLGFTKPVFNILGSERASFDDLGVDDVRCKSSVIECGKSEKVSVSRLTGTNITLQNESLISFENGHSSLFVSLVLSSFSNISRSASGSCIVCTTHPMGCFEMCNCSLSKCSSESQKGSQVAITSAEKILMESCVFEGSLEERTENYLNREEEICRWNGSVVDVAKSSAMLKDTTILNSPEGGITTSGGNVKIEKGEFLNNNPSIEGYPSLRRNIICSDSGILNVMSLKGGDGLERNTSLWMLDDGCSFEGIVSERDSSFVIPVLESVEAKKEANRMKLTFKGMLLVPCNLSFSVAKRKGDEKEIEKYDFDMEGFLSEREAEGSVAKDLLSSCGDEIEVSASILFGNAESPSSTNPFILKNASEAKGGDERIVEGENKEMSIWPIIVIVLVVILLIVLVGFILFVVRWKKQKRRTEELEVIVEDNIRKDPKAIEMVTMEMSPEDQWRRAEREAEKKNEERIKKMVFEKSLGHSESSEHLLSESGSTEYILGRDSDKIPEWMLEKVEEEEIRKRTPSPSVSSTSTTDSDSTFVRGEDLCPTTSSMSNLVDAMACSSPHEKLIVDLRDSLFMLLHGRNKTKEMAIGTLKEREQTAAQILFWVANLALHSFDEMENELSSLANLSPHLVLFSEHMVICIVMHSDLLSDDDSDSSSISSSTVATSVSDDDRDSLPSSAFEDEDDFRKECLRWKAPELLINKKMGATKESVAFSIGMMLWECLTLQIPFGEYEAEIAGEKSKMERGRPCSPSARLPSLSSSMPACR
ncbi:uncharacterized protein MONOS_15105 [Monocercomonoides exilis]|uniref:uncharacterized protein n=1 Tax=Monocercomonoides exilis TaxID=2049356 RepID=UPI00355A3017|nr:hypothetical protein MONOS_15105 [Monocercomonoides exilis]